MSGASQTRRLSTDEVRALKFAAHRQLSRWANKPGLSSHQQAKRDALKRAVRALEGHVFADGCEIHAPSEEANDDA